MYIIQRCCLHRLGFLFRRDLPEKHGAFGGFYVIIVITVAIKGSQLLLFPLSDCSDGTTPEVPSRHVYTMLCTTTFLVPLESGGFG